MPTKNRGVGRKGRSTCRTVRRLHNRGAPKKRTNSTHFQRHRGRSEGREREGAMHPCRFSRGQQPPPRGTVAGARTGAMWGWWEQHDSREISGREWSDKPSKIWGSLRERSSTARTRRTLRGVLPITIGIRRDGVLKWGPHAEAPEMLITGKSI